MAIMNNELAALIPSEARAQILFNLDCYLRVDLLDEDLFERWLEEGVPDGTESWEELADIEIEDFVEMWNLAERLMNTQAEGRLEDYEPDDIDDDTNYDPYTGAYDYMSDIDPYDWADY